MRRTTDAVGYDSVFGQWNQSQGWEGWEGWKWGDLGWADS